jgi:hypothetical protein
MMPLPDITYFEYVNSKRAEPENSSLSVSKFIEKDTLAQSNWLDYKTVQKNIDLYYQQDQGIKNRQKYIDSLWWWDWITQTKPRNDIENIKFINQRVEENQKFFKDNDDNANTLFGIYASGYATIMFVEKILLETYSQYFMLTTPAAFAIIGIALFNLLLDKYLFDYFWEKSTLDDRENFKLIMIIMIAIVCIPLEFYVIPIALLLYTAGYFINYMLQKGKLAEVINKIFFTQDEDGVPRMFEGFAIEANVKFNITHYFMLYTGTFGLSVLYGIAMAALAVMWIYPTVAGFATLAVGIGFAASPLGVLICIPLIAYGVIYAFFTSQAWARLVALHAKLSQRTTFKNIGFGKFLLLAFSELIIKFIDAITDYLKAVSTEMKTWNKKDSWQILGIILWGTLSLTWKLVKVAFSILTFYGMYYMLDQACEAIGEFINHAETGVVLAQINYIAQAPLMAQQAVNVILEKDIKDEHLPWYSEMRMTIFRGFNAVRTAFVPIGGEQASSSTERLLVASTGGASFVLVDPAMKNARVELRKTGDDNTKSLKV